MFDCAPKSPLLPANKKETNYLTCFCIILYIILQLVQVFQTLNFTLKSSNRVNIIREMFIFQALLPYVCFPFLHWVKLCRGCFRQAFFSFGRQKKWSLVTLDRWLSYVVRIIREFAWADTALVILDGWLSDRSSCLSKFNCIGFYLNFLPFCRHLMIQYNLLLHLFADFQQQQ